MDHLGKYVCFAFFLFSCLSSSAQNLEVEGQVKVDSMLLDIDADSVVVRRSDGLLAMRPVSTLSDYEINPELRNSFPVVSDGTHLAISGRYLFVSSLASPGGVQIYDVTNLDNPSLISELDNLPTMAFHVAGEYGYAVDSGKFELHTINLSKISDPVITERFKIGSFVSDIQGNGKYIAVTCPFEGEIKLIDVSNPNSPELVDSVEVGMGPGRIVMSGSYIYVTDQLEKKLFIIDLSSIEEGPIRGEVGLPEIPIAFDISGRFAYVIDLNGDLIIIDISFPFFSSIVHTFSIGGFPRDIFISGHYAFVGMSDGSIRVLNIEDVTAPYVETQIEIGASSSEKIICLGRHAMALDVIENKVNIIGLSKEDIMGAEIQSLEVGHLQAHNNIVTQGQLVASGGITAGEAGILSKGGLGVGNKAIFRDLVGIKETNPQEELDIRGNIRIQQVPTVSQITNAVPLYIEPDGTLKKGGFFGDAYKVNETAPLTPVLTQLTRIKSKSEFNKGMLDRIANQVTKEPDYFHSLIQNGGNEGGNSGEIILLLLQALVEQQEIISHQQSQINSIVSHLGYQSN